MVTVVAAALVVATAGTFVLLRLAVREDARRDLSRQARNLATRLDELERPQISRAFNVVLRLEDLRVLCLGSPCRGPAVPPPGIALGDLDPRRLEAGETVSGTRGPLVFAAAGTRDPAGALLVVVLTRRVETQLPGGLWLLALAAATLAVAARVAANLGERLTRPLRDAVAATRRVAAGDLAARVPLDPGERDELAALSESINSMAASLERSRGLERQFLLSVSHDLRTPLTSIRGYAEALAEGEAPDPAHAARVILSEARRLERRVGDLLELAKLDARRFSLDLRPTDVAEVAADTAEGFRPAAEAAGVELELALAPGVPAAAADPDRLAQVAANLIENAMKYAATRVEVGVGPGPGGRVELAVGDDGPGMAPEDVDHVFEPFFTSARRPARDMGTGLGLAIVHELVEAMGGTVRAEAGRDGTGTRVVVSLPARG